eukprot:COSAG01_NODE_3333_length_6238_cov_5.009448_2_plen_325_part_00
MASISTNEITPRVRCTLEAHERLHPATQALGQRDHNLPASVAPSIFRDKNRRDIDKSQSKRPPKRTQRPPHHGVALARELHRQVERLELDRHGLVPQARAQQLHERVRVHRRRAASCPATPRKTDRQAGRQPASQPSQPARQTDRQAHAHAHAHDPREARSRAASVHERVHAQILPALRFFSARGLCVPAAAPCLPVRSSSATSAADGCAVLSMVAASISAAVGLSRLPMDATLLLALAAAALASPSGSATTSRVACANAGGGRVPISTCVLAQTSQDTARRRRGWAGRRGRSWNNGNRGSREATPATPQSVRRCGAAAAAAPH